ncbi:MAG: sugar phosphate nucleotidyltransferase [Bacillota bacterium]
MKAIIMAGGEGSRLRPLTCDRPKPLTPLLNRPVMEHIVNLLKKHGIRQIGVTLQYLPEAIMEYFGDGSDWGVEMRYFLEETPLGTAGSVKNAEEFLDEPFIVISGDALTDFDLSRAIEFHRQKGAWATLVLTRVQTPLEYGVVMTDKNGSIYRFLEKPSWSEVFSDTVNTGIYILEPRVLQYIPAGQQFDFSKDLFPRLLAEGRPLFGCILAGYWCDIGNLQQYAEAHYAVLAGGVQLELGGQQVAPGVWAEAGAKIHPRAYLEGPAFIGADTVIDAEAYVGPFTVIGRNCHLGSKASLKRAVLWEGVNIGAGAEIRGAILCRQVKVGQGSRIYQGAVIGDGTVLGERVYVDAGVKIWPQKRVESGARLRENLVWGERQPRTLFGREGIVGEINRELTPEQAVKVAAAFATLFQPETALLVSTDHSPAAAMLKHAVLAGLLGAGMVVWDAGILTSGASRYLIRSLAASGGVHIQGSGQGNRARVLLLNQQGASLTPTEERKVENLLGREGMRRTAAGHLGRVMPLPSGLDEYTGFLLNFRPRGQNYQWRIGVGALTPALAQILPRIFQDTGFRLIYLQDGEQQLEQLISLVQTERLDLGLWFGEEGERLSLVLPGGMYLAPAQVQILKTWLYAQRKEQAVIPYPVHWPQALARRLQERGAVIQPVKTNPGLIQNQWAQDEEGFYLLADDLYTLLVLLRQAEEQGLERLLQELPDFNWIAKSTACPWEAKGLVMRRLMEELQDRELELLDGIKLWDNGAWALVLPDSEEPVCRIYAEGPDMEIAESLTEQLLQKISEIQKESEGVG